MPWSKEDKESVCATIEALDCGMIRVAEYNEVSEKWQVNTWVKQAILYYFQIQEMVSFEVGPYCYRDKIPLKTNYKDMGVRVVPPATARYGSFMEPGVVLMPSYVNIGAYVGQGSMVDTWATVGSCAQVGKRVHLSGGVGLGGVLEPPSASPVIIEDGAFVGSRCIVVEGVKVGKQAVLAANLTLTSSTPIYDLNAHPMQVYRGEVPPRAVVVPGVRKKDMPGGEALLGCAYILGERKASTDEKTSLNEVLRDYSVSV
ncbi:MAG: 2,3,4,5-tetrahydropyridine-2,6-dicarboxylate N-succinyltransferase [Proteobacteria bacterium]|nr:2,3,4,5-tetrahydropyridine-2,6-dicarboxylate N-succinyltransferase [Pseudomonadota bacterium]